MYDPTSVKFIKYYFILCGFVVLLQTVNGDNITIINALRCVECPMSVTT